MLGFSWLDRLSSRLRSRADSEHEQAVIRLVIGVLSGIYLVCLVLRRSQGDTADLRLLICLGVFLTISASIMAAVVLRPQISPSRRHLGLLFDMSTISYLLQLDHPHPWGAADSAWP